MADALAALRQYLLRDRPLFVYCARRIFDETAEAEGVRPYVLVRPMTRTPSYHLRGVTDLDRSTFDVDVVADTGVSRATGVTLVRQRLDQLHQRVYAGVHIVRGAIEDMSFGWETPADGSQGGRYHGIVEVVLWHRR